MKYRIKLRRDTAANWAQANPILAGGEPGLETDTGQIKYGNGTTPWNQLTYWSSKLKDNKQVTITAGNDEVWVRTNEDNENDSVGNPRVRYDSEGNIIFSTTNNSDDTCSVTKYTPTGEVVWSKKFDWRGNDIAVDSQDDVYVALQWDASEYSYVVKLSGATGVDIWSQAIDSGYENYEWESLLETDSEGNVAVACTTNYSTNQLFVYKLNAVDGSLAWAQLISQTTPAGIWATGIGTDANKNIYVSGSTQNDNGYNIGVVMKLTTNGVVEWSKTLEFDTLWAGYYADSNFNIDGGDIDVDSAGNVSVSFEFQTKVSNSLTDWVNSPQNTTAVAVMRLDTEGTQLWVRRVGPGGCQFTSGGLAVDDDGYTYISSIMWTGGYGTQPSEAYYTSEYEFAIDSKEYQAVAKYDPDGNVVWQRYLKFGAHNYLWRDNNNDTMLAVHDGKLVTGAMSQRTDGNNDRSSSNAYIVQLTTDGQEQEVGEWKFFESRIPGVKTKFITSNDYSFDVENRTSNIEYGPSEAYNLTDSDVASDIVRADGYEFKFDSRGTLTIPNDGEIRLTQNVTGFFNIIGRADNDSGDVYGDCIAVDDQGNTYVGGQTNDNNDGATITKYDPDGRKVWSNVIYVDDNANTNNVWSLSIKGDYVVANGEGYDYDVGNSFGFYAWFDRETGVSMNGYNVMFFGSSLTGDYDLYNYAHASIGSDDNWTDVFAGEKYGSYQEFKNVPAQTGSDATGTIVILASSVDTGTDWTFSSSWLISGPNIDGYDSISVINKYENVSPTTVQGSGVIVGITSDGSNYSVSSLDNGGTNYQVGHKIIIPGTAFGAGFASPANDCILTVDTVSGTTVTGFTVSGTPADAGSWGSLSSLSNYNVGSGLNFDTAYYTNVNYDSGDFWFNNGGSNYVVGDIVTVAGTALGGVSPDNDLTITVTAVDGGGAVTGTSISGTAQTTKYKIRTNSNWDFTQNNTYSFWQANDADAFIAVNGDFIKTFNYGDPYENESVVDMATDGTNVYVLGRTYNDSLHGYWMSYVAKFDMSNNAEHVWTKVINNSDYDSYPYSIAINGNSLVTFAGDDDNGPVISKFDLDGNFQWSKYVSGNGNWDGSVAVDINEDIYLVFSDYENYQTGFTVMRFNPMGGCVWKNHIRAEGDYSFFDNNRGHKIALSDNAVHITGCTNAPSDYNTNGVVFKVPKDGSGHGYWGYWLYQPADHSVNNSGTTDYLEDISSLYKENNDPTFNTNSGYLYTGYQYSQGVTAEAQIRDTDGGKIWFADGSYQDSSGQDIPQRVTRGGEYYIGMRDRGQHIFCTSTDSYHNIYVPLHRDEPMPIGSVITIVNDADRDVYINRKRNIDELVIVGVGNGTSWTWGLPSPGIATLMKVGVNRWFVAGSGLYNND